MVKMFYIQDISDWTVEQTKIYNLGLKELSKMTFNNNSDITKILMIKTKGNKFPKVAKAKYWISDLNKYRQFLAQYKLR